MKKIPAAFLSLLCSLFSFAQNNAETKPIPWLFEYFTKGQVLLKSGSTEYASLNYNTDDQTIAFEKDGKTMILTGLETIDTIYFFNKRFVPGPDDHIYEVITSSPVAALCASYYGKLKPAIAVTDKNGTSHKEAGEASNTMSGIYVLRPYKGDYTVEIQKSFWLIKHKQLYKANSEKQFNKVFSHQETAISKYIADNKIRFNNENDLIKLTAFCNALL